VIQLLGALAEIVEEFGGVLREEKSREHLS
jgi:hypothetical protein